MLLVCSAAGFPLMSSSIRIEEAGMMEKNKIVELLWGKRKEKYHLDW